MKKIIGLFFSLMMCLSFTSCIVPAEAQVYEGYTSDGVDVNLVINYGTRYCSSDGLLLYYFFNGLYYYPVYSSNGWYFRTYPKPINRYRPLPLDFHRHRPYVRHEINHHRIIPKANHRPSVNNYTGGNISRPQLRDSHNTRPQINRSIGNHNRNVGHFGGRR